MCESQLADLAPRCINNFVTPGIRSDGAHNTKADGACFHQVDMDVGERETKKRDIA